MEPDTDFVTVYFVRHGETVGNLKVWILPPDQDVLSDGGKNQAKLLGQYLKDQGEKFDKAFCSPYARTVETCEIVLAETESQIREGKRDERIREIYLGKYENGDARAVFKELFSCGLADYLDWEPEGAETRLEKGQRLTSFLEDLTATIDQECDSGEKILVVSHGGILYQMWVEILALNSTYKLLNWKPEYKLVMKNTGYFKVKMERNPKAGEPRRIEIVVGLAAFHLEQLENDPIYKFSKTSRGKVLDGCIQQ